MRIVTDMIVGAEISETGATVTFGGEIPGIMDLRLQIMGHPRVRFRPINTRVSGQVLKEGSIGSSSVSGPHPKHFGAHRGARRLNKKPSTITMAEEAPLQLLQELQRQMQEMRAEIAAMRAKRANRVNDEGRPSI
ncbi:uncharacterized protein LOC111241879 [Vigna radiata var. radiata]|uniref:Uncharacterized protein LOC111241879 n=1 Tax=Vigna radiata var. radiata TaxID=3916 RepID=A0A3Q0F3G9_VIGRR|nr:uncharacterized protein LOC111241879 [Vigna radiata var. radiata]